MKASATSEGVRTGKGDIDGGIVAADHSVGEALLAQPGVGRVRAEAHGRHQPARHIVVRCHAACRAEMSMFLSCAYSQFSFLLDTAIGTLSWSWVCKVTTCSSIYACSTCEQARPL